MLIRFLATILTPVLNPILRREQAYHARSDPPQGLAQARRPTPGVLSAAATTVLFVEDRRATCGIRAACANDLEVQTLDLLGHGTDLSVTNGSMVYLGNRGYLSPGTHDKDLIGNVELGAVDHSLLSLNAQVRRHLEDGIPSDSFEDIGSDRRSNSRLRCERQTRFRHCLRTRVRR